MTCPGCRQAMAAQVFQGRYGREVALDLCHGCGVLWFDGLESVVLTPGAILRLFVVIHEQRPTGRSPLPDALACPRCNRGLVRTSDMQRHTRFSYWRCPAEEGRLMTFFDFLREKNFVRPLDARELAELRERVQTLTCSSCGAPVDIVAGSDDTAAIYATFRAAPPGAEVFFPPGTYKMDPRSPDNRVIKSHTLVRGVSAASVLRLGSGALDGGSFGQNDILLRNADPGTGNDDIQVVGLAIDGNARGNPGPLVVEGFPLYFARVRGLSIEDVAIVDAKAGALAIQLCDAVVVRGSPGQRRRAARRRAVQLCRSRNLRGVHS